MPRDWRTDPTEAARTLLTVINDSTSFTRGEDARVVQRWTPGTFVRSLVETMLRADPTNLALLGIGFPAWARAVAIYKHEDDGLLGLREQADWDNERPTDG